MKKECVVEGCARNRFGHGYCNMHYKRWKKNGTPGNANPHALNEGCSVTNCPEPHCALGFCNTHWTRFKTTGKIPTTPIRRYHEEKEECPRLFCTAKVALKGLCQRHYSRLKLFESYQSGFSWENYDSMWSAQNGTCAICSAELVWDSKLAHVDHDHLTGKIRGILCVTCNQGLGSFKDSPDTLMAAAGYLQNFLA